MTGMAQAVEPLPPGPPPQGADRQAVEALFAASYDDLRRLARARLRHAPRGTCLGTTSIVHESYLRCAAAGRLRAEDRPRFLAYAGRVMRSVIVDFVRARMAGRRGGAAPHVTLTPQVGEAVAAGEREILRVHEALDGLAARDVRLARVVELRYFGGLLETEIAEALGVTERTVRRDWEKARLLLAESLQ